MINNRGDGHAWNRLSHKAGSGSACTGFNQSSRLVLFRYLSVYGVREHRGWVEASVHPRQGIVYVSSTERTG